MTRRVVVMAGLLVVMGLLVGATTAFAAGPRTSQSAGYAAGAGGYAGQGLISVAADELGLTTTELVAELGTGKTVAQVASDLGVDVDAIVEAFKASRLERLDAALAAGRITPEEAAEHLALRDERIAEHLNEGWTPGERIGAGICGGDPATRLNQGRGFRGGGAGMGRTWAAY